MAQQFGYSEGVTHANSTIVFNAFGVTIYILLRTQGGAAAPLTLGYGVVPLRGTTCGDHM